MSAIIDLEKHDALGALKNVMEKIKAKEFLTFEEQCVVMVATVSMASDVGCKATQEYVNGHQSEYPIEMHPLINKFIEALPTKQQAILSEFGAISCGLNLDGSERETSSNIVRKSVICKTYIIRKIGTTEVKIGKSIQVEKRIRTLKTQSGANLEVLAVIPKDIEAMLHRQFCELRTVGEWFDDSKGLIAAFAAKQGGAA